MPGNIYSFEGFVPYIHESAYVHPTATIIGNVNIGKNVFIGPGAVLRGDWGEIIVKDGCNIQDNCILHIFPGVAVILEENAHIGHGAIIHSAHIGRDTLIGMNAVIMDDAKIGNECIVGAMALVTQGTIIPDRSLVVGNPAKVVKQISDEMIYWKKEGTKLYQELVNQMKNTLTPCEPLRTPPKFRPPQEQTYKTWPKTKKK